MLLSINFLLPESVGTPGSCLFKFAAVKLAIVSIVIETAKKIFLFILLNVF